MMSLINELRNLFYLICILVSILDSYLHHRGGREMSAEQPINNELNIDNFLKSRFMYLFNHCQ